MTTPPVRRRRSPATDAAQELLGHLIDDDEDIEGTGLRACGPRSGITMGAVVGCMGMEMQLSPRPRAHQGRVQGQGQGQAQGQAQGQGQGSGSGSGSGGDDMKSLDTAYSGTGSAPGPRSPFTPGIEHWLI